MKNLDSNNKTPVYCQNCGVDMKIEFPSFAKNSYVCDSCLRKDNHAPPANTLPSPPPPQFDVKNVKSDIEPPEFQMKDSGKRQEFSTGAIRDTAEGKGRYDLISPIATKRLAIILEKGSKKYSARNWERGMNLSRLVDSAKRHLDQFLEGNRDEDHAGQAFFNVMALIHTEEMIRRGILPPELNDLPNFLPKTNSEKAEKTP